MLAGVGSTLTLFVPRVGADHAHDVLALNDLAMFTQPFDGRSDFHRCSGKNGEKGAPLPGSGGFALVPGNSTVAERDASLRQIVGTHL